MSEPTRFHLIRHALVEPTARATFYGSLDVAVCDLALREEAALYRWLAARLPQPARWVVTHLGRTRATAAAIFAAGYPEQPLQTGRIPSGRMRRRNGRPAGRACAMSANGSGRCSTSSRRDMRARMSW